MSSTLCSVHGQTGGTPPERQGMESVGGGETLLINILLKFQ